MTEATTEKIRKEIISGVSNGGQATIDDSRPYTVRVKIQGTAAILFHKWDCDAVYEKDRAKKNSKAKKTDNIDSYTYRTENGELAIPGEYLRQSIISAGAFYKDPRSPRKSAKDLLKAGIAALTETAGLGVKDWDYVDRRRAVVQRAGITRERPAMRIGWSATFEFAVLIPEYITEDLLLTVIGEAGRLVGIGDFRPTFGRFAITSFERTGGGNK